MTPSSSPWWVLLWAGVSVGLGLGFWARQALFPRKAARKAARKAKARKR